MKTLIIYFESGKSKELPCNKINQAMSLLSAHQDVLIHDKIKTAFFDGYNMQKELYLLKIFKNYSNIMERLKKYTINDLYAAMCEYKHRDNNDEYGKAYSYLIEIKIAIESKN